jgi:hypothetical protein
MPGWLERKATEWFGTHEKKVRLFQWLVYITNLYIFFGVCVLIYVLYGDHLIQIWNNLTR